MVRGRTWTRTMAKRLLLVTITEHLAVVAFVLRVGVRQPAVVVTVACRTVRDKVGRGRWLQRFRGGNVHCVERRELIVGEKGSVRKREGCGSTSCSSGRLNWLQRSGSVSMVVFVH